MFHGRNKSQRKSIRERAGVDVIHRKSSDREVISKRIKINIRNTRKREKKRVIGKNEEERGEGTTLLDTPLNVYRDRGGAPETGRDADVGESAYNEPSKPARKLELHEDHVKPPMVDRVEGLSGVKQEKEAVLICFNTFIEEPINILDMIATLPAREEALLRRVDDV